MGIIELPAGMAPGFRFYPTDEELIKDYLKPKLLGEDSEVDQVVAEADFCKIEPWDLPLESKIKSKDRMWLFFCEQRLKLVKTSSKKMAKTESADMIWKITGKKKTGTGSWKITGEEKEIKDQNTRECIGKKRTLVFDKTHNKNKKWVMQEFYMIPGNPLPDQTIYVLRRLKEKPNNKVKTSDGGEGEPSDDIRSEVENSATPAAISSGPCVISHLEKETDEMGGTPCRGVGKPSGDITSDVENQVATIVTPEVHGCVEENADSPLSRDLISIHSNYPNNGQHIDSGMDKFRLVPENFLLHKGPYVISGVENKTDEKAGSPGCYVGEPSGDITSSIGNQVAPTAIPEECGHTEVNAGSLSHPFVSPDCHFTEKDTTLNFANSFNDNQNNMQATCEADDKEAVEFADQLIVDPSENYNGEMANNLSNGSIQPTSLKRLSSSVDTGVEGVVGWFKRSRTLASENHSDG